ncbi:hypothetical protein SAICODRAFT_29464 [Saitoella complicata NRRL Y-17804]|nr:uncharacterized protein SAICODRAFT_29464 [Saitoella complicata NRRL Y-17804]ODQ54855.1 hypothetical protein SAICODRAFT_29464 [Saitoella complicata NRRL Y-17804]
MTDVPDRELQAPFLPPDKVYSIQIGSEVFRISGAALCSDAPSYFTCYFENNEDKTLILDRDPEVFQDIVRYLRGYYVTPKSEEHFIYLCSDAMYYKLSRLQQRLFQEYHIDVGGRSFRIEKDIFNEVQYPAGDGNNFFTLGFASLFNHPNPQALLSTHEEMYGDHRPPEVPPSRLPRSSALFQDILAYLQNYEVEIRSETHRQNLMKDARFYGLRALVEKIAPGRNEFNGWEEGEAPNSTEVEDVVLPVEGVKGPGLSVDASKGQIWYKRPYIDTEAAGRQLILQVKNFVLNDLHFSASSTEPKVLRCSGHKYLAKKLKHLLGPLQIPKEDSSIAIEIGDDAAVTLDGHDLELDDIALQNKVRDDEEPAAKRIKTEAASGTTSGPVKFRRWVVTKALLRPCVREESGKQMLWLCVVKMEATSNQKETNKAREWI